MTTPPIATTAPTKAGRIARVRHSVARRLAPPPPPDDLVQRALPAARARSVAEALAAFLLGFVLDDVGALRVPGFAAGAAVAVALLAFGSVAHARGLARRLADAPEDGAARVLYRARLGWRIAVVIVVLMLVAWIVLTAGGVNLWPR